MATADTTVATQCEWIKITAIFFCQIGQKNLIYFFGVLQNFSNSLCVPGDEKSWKSLSKELVMGLV